MDDFPSPADRQRVSSGEIPWSLDEQTNAIGQANWLHETPHDDWDRKKREFSIADYPNDGDVSKFRLNVDNFDNQLMGFLVGQNREQEYDQTTAMSHMWRLMEIQIFIADHFEDLQRDGLIRDCDDNPEMAEFSGALLEVLAVDPYQGKREVRGEIQKTFDYEAVMLKAKALMNEEDADSNE